MKTIAAVIVKKNGMKICQIVPVRVTRAGTVRFMGLALPAHFVKLHPSKAKALKGSMKLAKTIKP